MCMFSVYVSYLWVPSGKMPFWQCTNYFVFSLLNTACTCWLKEVHFTVIRIHVKNRKQQSPGELINSQRAGMLIRVLRNFTSHIFKDKFIHNCKLS